MTEHVLTALGKGHQKHRWIDGDSEIWWYDFQAQSWTCDGFPSIFHNEVPVTLGPFTKVRS